MKPHLDIQQEGNLGTKNITEMAFHAPSTSFLMSILTDMYEDAEAATIREIAANALDSHVEAGNTAPIRVYLPTVLSPVFTVQDFGTGMSRHTIENVFALYGASTKRETDDQVGMLGLGAKSPLAYASQFTLISVQDGIKCVVLVARKDDGGGTVQIVDEDFTDDPNGVTVEVPVGYADLLCRKAREHFRYWAPGTVLINDEVPECVWTDESVVHIDDDIVFVGENEYNPNDMIVMGNIAYPIPRNSRKLDKNSRQAIVARVPMGVVDFTPSRDGLQMTARTKETVSDVYDFVHERIQRNAQDDVDAAPTHFEAIKRVLHWKHAYFGMADLKYKHAKVPLRFQTGKPDYDEQVPVLDDKGNQKLGYNNKLAYRFQRVQTTPDEKNLAYEWTRYYSNWNERASQREAFRVEDILENTLHVIGYPRMGLRSETKDKVKIYITENNLDDVEKVLFYKRAFGSPWLDDVVKVDWETVKAIKLPTDGITARKRAVGWRVHTGTNHVEVEQESLDPNKGVVYLDADMRWEHSLRRELATFLGEDLQLVIVPVNRKARFEREFPTATAAKALIEILVNKGVPVTDPEAYILGRAHTEDCLMSLYPKQVLDRELAELIVQISAATKTVRAGSQRRDQLVQWGSRFGLDTNNVSSANYEKQAIEFNNRVAKIFGRYPLVCEASGARYLYNAKAEYILGYVNAMFISSFVLDPTKGSK